MKIGAMLMVCFAGVFLLGMAEASMMEMTHLLNSRSQHWPLFRSFSKTTVVNVTQPDGLW